MTADINSTTGTKKNNKNYSQKQKQKKKKELERVETDNIFPLKC
jgi:hypothetical protein